MEQVLIKNIDELKTKDLSVPTVVVISRGTIKCCQLPDFGETTIITNEGKVTLVEHREKIKF